MSPPSTVTSILEIVAVAADARPEAEACLSAFAALSEDDQEATRSTTIAKLFPLVFGDIAAVESSENFQELKESPW